jgi:hypothetical protein
MMRGIILEKGLHSVVSGKKKTQDSFLEHKKETEDPQNM